MHMPCNVSCYCGKAIKALFEEERVYLKIFLPVNGLCTLICYYLELQREESILERDCHDGQTLVEVLERKLVVSGSSTTQH